MKTLPREPWRGGQICGYQTEYGVVPGRVVFCGELKALGLYFCQEHHDWLLLDGPIRVAEGNAIGLEVVPSLVTEGDFLARDADGEVKAGANSRKALEFMLGFSLQWEPYAGIAPIQPTDDELRAYKESA